MERSDWKCDVCRAETKTLNIHHGYYKYGIDPWDLPKDTLWCLCDQCHQEAQQNLAEIKLELGRISPEDYEDVLRSLWLLQGEDN
jgi:hypothetical protein